YIQDIDTERIIQDRLEEKMERNEFIKETMSNLMLTLLGLSFLADDNLLKILMVFIFIGVNIWTFYVRRKKMKEKKI
ncbi:MAG: hypothetical protein GY870_06275, partial [archaeon]|nr:hypothetical protein [archaeon]